MVRLTTIQSPQVMSEWQHDFQDSCMNPPKIEEIETEDGKRWRVIYAGMVKDHKQQWQAVRHYNEACEVYGQQLGLRRWLDK